MEGEGRRPLPVRARRVPGPPRHGGSRRAPAIGIEVVESGEPLVLFPEGTRQSGPLVNELFEGAAYVAMRTGVPIVPVGIGGSERAMPKGSKFLRPVRIAIVIGEPIVPPVADGRRGSRRAVRELTDQLHKQLQVLFDAAQVQGRRLSARRRRASATVRCDDRGLRTGRFHDGPALPDVGPGPRPSARSCGRRAS